MKTKFKPRGGYTEAQYREVLRLRREGMGPKKIAAHMNIPLPTLSYWLMRAGDDGEREVVASERIRLGMQRRLEEHREEVAKHSAHYNDPNVSLLGDPPLYRSALGKKLAESNAP